VNQIRNAGMTRTFGVYYQGGVEYLKDTQFLSGMPHVEEDYRGFTSI
jgi:hypothetical protein